MTCGIYRFVNKISDKCYIGQSVNMENRFKDHEQRYLNYTGEPFSKFYNALWKHGLDNFTSEYLEICKPEQLNEKEIYWINYYDSFNNGYNMTVGGGAFGHGEDVPGAILSNQDVLKIKEMLKNTDMSFVEIAETINNCTVRIISNINLGHSWTYLGEFKYPIREDTRGNLCLNCGAPIKSNSIRCWNCYNKYGREDDKMRLAKLNRDQLIEIKNLLKNTELSLAKIANIYDVSTPTISDINRGLTWGEVGDFSYPIREIFMEVGNTCRICNEPISYGAETCKKCYGILLGSRQLGNENHRAKIEEDLVKKIKYYLKYKSDTSMKDIARNFNVGYSTVKHINRGDTWSHVDKHLYTYPIR